MTSLCTCIHMYVHMHMCTWPSVLETGAEVGRGGLVTPILSAGTVGIQVVDTARGPDVLRKAWAETESLIPVVRMLLY